MIDLEKMGQKAQSAAFELGQLGTKKKNNALLNMANALVLNTSKIIEANKEDIANAKKNGIKEAMIDRLLLTPDRINDKNKKQNYLDVKRDSEYSRSLSLFLIKG